MDITYSECVTQRDCHSLFMKVKFCRHLKELSSTIFAIVLAVICNILKLHDNSKVPVKTTYMPADR